MHTYLIAVLGADEDVAHVQKVKVELEFWANALSLNAERQARLTA